MKNKPTLKDQDRSYIHLSRAWYFDSNLSPKDRTVDEVLFGFYPAEGGTYGELLMQWRVLDGLLIPQLTVWDDAWAALWGLKDVLNTLAMQDGRDIGPRQFCDLLELYGFRDMTVREKPAHLKTHAPS